MTENRSFPIPTEYMLASTFSGRVVFTSESLISYLGYDVTGRNLNELFSDEVSMHILYNCRNTGKYQADRAHFSDVLVSLKAQAESDEILIFVRPSFTSGIISEVHSPVNKVSRELDSSISVISMMLDNISAGGADVSPDSIALMNKQLMKLTRLSKNIATYSQHLAKEHFVNYKKVSVNSFISSLIVSISELVSDMPIEFSVNLPEDDIFAMIDTEKMRRAFLNVITNSIASRIDSVSISITVYPVVSDIINIVIRDNGRGFTPRVSSDKCDASTIAQAYNSFGFAVSHIFLELHGGHFSVISEQDKGTVVSISFPRNMDKHPPSFSSLIPSYSGSINELLMELSPILPTEKFTR